MMIVSTLKIDNNPTSPNQLIKVFDSSNNPEGFKDDSDGVTDPDDDYGYDAVLLPRFFYNKAFLIRKWY
jgi:adenine specific DNA methylase Mod